MGEVYDTVQELFMLFFAPISSSGGITTREGSGVSFETLETLRLIIV